MGGSLEVSSFFLETYACSTVIKTQAMNIILTVMLLIGLGGGLLICTILLYQMEKSLDRN
jgi:ABC-type thiamin/hydroxymethylpyrimidine transport system permease subunit